MKNQSNIICILLIGPMSTEIGGARISFQHLVNHLQIRSDVTIVTIDTHGIRNGGLLAAWRFAKLLYSITRLLPRSDIISLQMSVTGVPVLGPFVVALARIYKRPLVFRQFGGLGYDGLSGVRAWITKFVCKHSNLYLAQTKALLDVAMRDGIHHASWFPTSRPRIEEEQKAGVVKTQCRRFVFVGQLKVEKGLQVLVHAAEGLPKDYVVDVYGPWYDLPKDTFDNAEHVRYCGVIPPAEVTRTLNHYDALLLPTFLEQEGYSGVILEAYSVGIPVIATRWNPLPEIVLDGQTGLLVKPKDPADLCAAMLKLMQDDALYVRLSKGAAAFGQQFSMENQSEKFVACCQSLVAKRK